MTVALPDDRVWNAANWVARGLCDDALPHLAAYPGVAAEIEECLQTELYYINLKGASGDVLAQARALVGQGIADDVDRGADHFQDPSGFPVYLEKLRQLDRLIAEALAKTSGSRSLQRCSQIWRTASSAPGQSPLSCMSSERWTRQLPVKAMS
jgi:hypothetical protein